MNRKRKPKNFNPVDNFPKNHKHFGKKRCQAWNSNQGRQCLSLAMRNKRVCYKHGGATPGGIASANWKHGRFSSYIPIGLKERYISFIIDPESIALRDEIALVRLRLTDLLEKIGDMPDSGSTWQELRKEFRDFEKFQKDAAILEGKERENKLRSASNSLENVKKIIVRGVKEWEAWGEIMSLIEQTRRLADSEQKRLIAGEQLMAMEDVLTLFDYIVNLINDVVTDPKEKSRISEGLYRFNRSEQWRSSQSLLDR